MDFHRAFNDIDEDGCGEITRQDLENYMRRMNYQENFVQKWLNLFDIDHNGTISYEEYCTTLGLVPKQEVVEKALKNQAEGRGRRIAAKKRLRAASTRNSALNSSGVMRFSRARVIEKKALYRYKPVSTRGSGKMTAKKGASPAPRLARKPISGAKNGEVRLVPAARSPRSLPTQQSSRAGSTRRRVHLAKDQARRFRKSMRPGAVLILLSGAHRGKRVVLLKHLESGLLLVSGPYKLNGCPLRRVHQNYVIGTSTRIDLSKTKVPTHLNDLYFQRSRAERRRGTKEDGDIFKKEQQKYELTDQHKIDQKEIDQQILASIRNHKEASHLRQYLRSRFGLKRGEQPHRMIF